MPTRMPTASVAIPAAAKLPSGAIGVSTTYVCGGSPTRKPTSMRVPASAPSSTRPDTERVGASTSLA